jgi:RNA-binding protein
VKKTPVKLTAKQVRYLRGLGHHLSPKVLIGHEGITEKLLASLQAVLVANELVKIKILSNSGVDRQDAAQIIAGTTHAHVIQVLGKTILIYRENKDRKPDKKIQLP